MHIPKPVRNHPPEVYEAILRECGREPLRLGAHLRACGWALVDAAYAVAQWDAHTLAVALANERTKRRARLTASSEAELAEIRLELAATPKPAAAVQAKRTTHIVHSPELFGRATAKPRRPEQ